MRAFGERDACGVRADVAGDAGQRVNARALVDGQAEVLGREAQGAGGRKREGCLTKLGRVDAEEEVVHDRVADEDGLENVIPRHARVGADPRDQRADGLPHGLRQRLAPVGVHHHVRDAAHQILAEADLRVGGAGRGERPAREQRDEVGRDGRRADIDGDAEGEVVKARPKRRDDGRACAVVVDGCRHLPFALAQDRLESRQEMGVEPRLDLPFLGQCRQQPLHVARRLLHVRRLDLDVAKVGGDIAGDCSRLGPLAHHLLVDGDVRRHVDDEIALDQGRAGEPPAGRQRALLGVACFRRRNGADIPGRRRHLVLGESAEGGLHLAAAADASASAHAFDVDAERAGGRQERRADREPAALARRHEQHEGGPGLVLYLATERHLGHVVLSVALLKPVS